MTTFADADPVGPEKFPGLTLRWLHAEGKFRLVQQIKPLRFAQPKRVAMRRTAA